MIYKLYQFKHLKNEKKPNWQWMAAYHFSQEKKRIKSKDFTLIDKLSESLFTGNELSTDKQLDLICLGANWAELYNRKTDDDASKT